MPRIDAPTTSGIEAPTKRYVEVPDIDIFDYTFPTIRINLLEFPPGRHYVDASIADTIEDRVRARKAADLRLLTDKPDLNSERAMNKFGTGGRSGQATREFNE